MQRPVHVPRADGVSTDNVPAARRALDAFYGDEVVGAEDLVHEEFEFVEAPDVPDAERFSGENWFAEVIERFGEVWMDPPGQFEAHEFIDLGDDVVVRGRLTLRGKASGITVTNEIAILFEFCDGKLRRASNYPSEAAARAAIASSRRPDAGLRRSQFG
jgi:ketosteroid isomerase-like protein